MNGKEFINAINALSKEKGIPVDDLFSYIEVALNSAYKRNYNATNSKVKINRDTGEVKVYSYKIVVDEINMDDDEDAQVLLEEVKDKYPDLKVGDEIEEEVTPKDFGRVAASTAKQVLVQKIREAERKNLMDEYKDKQGEMLIGTLQREDKKNYYVDFDRASGILPKKDIIPGEKLEMGSKIKVYVTKIEEGEKGGPIILLSRSHYGFVKRLLESEIPELSEGLVILYSIAREAGSRTKIAVYSENEKIDPVGACVGNKGMRINNIIKELNGEKIDVILYSKDLKEFIKNALSPAKDLDVYIMDEKNKSAVVVAEGDNLSLAIGKNGQNVKLASKLTKCKIEVKTLVQVQEEGINIYKYYEA